MTTPLAIGMTHEITVSTHPEHTARYFHQNLPDVFATPFLAGFMERACAELIDRHIGTGQQSVGGAMDLKHTAATPLGMPVSITATLTAIAGKKLTFTLAARDEHEKIGEAIHVRFIIDREKFNAGIAEKARRTPEGTTARQSGAEPHGP